MHDSPDRPDESAGPGATAREQSTLNSDEARYLLQLVDADGGRSALPGSVEVDHLRGKLLRAATL